MQVTRVRAIGLIKEGGWIAAGHIFSLVGTLVLVRVLTEHLIPAEYGTLALALTVGALVNQVVMGGIGGGIARYYSIASESHDLSGYLQASLKLFLFGVAMVVAVFTLVILGLLSFDRSSLAFLVLVAAIYSLVASYNSIISGIQNAARQRVVVAIHSTLLSWLKLAMAVIAIYLFGGNSASVIAGYFFAIVLVSLSQTVVLRKFLVDRVAETVTRNDWIGKIWKYSWPFSAWGLFTWGQQVSDRWAIELSLNSESVGLYAAVFQLGYAPISAALSVVITFLAPIVFQRSGDATDSVRNKDVHDLTWKLAALALAGTLLVFVLTWIWHDWLFGLLVATEYRKASYLLPWIVLAGGLFAAGQMLSLKLMSELKSVSLLFPKVTTAVLGVAFNFAGAAVAGVDGVVGGLIAFSILYFFWMAGLVRTHRLVV